MFLNVQNNIAGKLKTMVNIFRSPLCCQNSSDLTSGGVLYFVTRKLSAVPLCPAGYSARSRWELVESGGWDSIYLLFTFE